MTKKIALGKGLASLIGPDIVSRTLDDDRTEVAGSGNVTNAGPAASLAAKNGALAVAAAGLMNNSNSTSSSGQNIRSAEEMGGPILIDISTLKVNRYQPRKNFSERELEELGNSIRENGLIQPLIVTRTEDGYELIAGERRLRACKLIGVRKVPVIIKRVTDKDKLAMAIIENVQRSDLNCVEEACAYYQLMEDFNLTQEEVAKKVGKERSSIANFLRILNLPSAVIELLQQNSISFGHAKILAGLKDSEKIEKLAHEIYSKGYSVRELESIVKAMQAGGGEKPTKGKAPEVDEKLDFLRQDIEKKTGLHVMINSKGVNAPGSITIKYNGKDEFNRIYDLLIRR
ncbi:MAG: ParB/RepB/Spo0J family partition protein [Oligoflexia bacterium]|nr:ParB/RepB/Spo0J family partition protein [Oligoflexia bacterium]MBF0367585.1 ParB/RepB/Spo0J family partition protein [Oligoflexia bacterium]